MEQLSPSSLPKPQRGKHAQWWPSIYGDKVVYLDNSHGNQEVYLLDLSSKKKTRVTRSALWEQAPVIRAGKVAYTRQFPGSWLPSPVYEYDIAKGTSRWIAFNPSADISRLQISGSRVVYTVRAYLGAAADPKENLRLFNVKTMKKKVFKSASEQRSPDIYKDTIVYQGNAAGSWDIYKYDIRTQKRSRVTRTKHNDTYPSAWGNRVVFVRTVGKRSCVYIHDLKSHRTRKLTKCRANQFQPDIYRSRIVLQDTRNGSANPDIYLYDLKTKKERRLTK